MSHSMKWMNSYVYKYKDTYADKPTWTSIKDSSIYALENILVVIYCVSFSF